MNLSEKLVFLSIFLVSSSSEILFQPATALSKIQPSTNSNKTVLVSNSSENLCNFGPWTDGIGARVISRKDGGVLTGQIKLSKPEALPGANPYIYTGFNSKEGQNDIGFVWSKSYQGWMPYILYPGKKKIQDTTLIFAPNSTIAFSLYKNRDGFAMFEISGQDKSGRFVTNKLFTIPMKNVKAVCWKFNATVAGDQRAETGKNYAEFSNLEVDGQPISLEVSGSDSKKTTKTSINGNNVVISINGKPNSSLNLQGKWKGILTQPGKRFNYQLTLKSVELNKFTGVARIAIEDSPNYFGVMNLTGQLVDDELQIKETEISSQNIRPEWHWCLKTMNLKVVSSNNTISLDGPWFQPGCNAGNVKLRRE
jgi:Domain of unknown function, YrpD